MFSTNCFSFEVSDAPGGFGRLPKINLVSSCSDLSSVKVLTEVLIAMSSLEPSPEELSKVATLKGCVTS